MRHTWPPIYKLVHRSGNHSYIVDLGLRDGKRKRKAFRTRDEAETFAIEARQARRRVGELAFQLDAALMAEAAECHRRLFEHGLTLTRAAEFAIKHLATTAPTVRQITSEMVEAAARNGRRARTIEELRIRLAKFAATFGDRKPGTIGVKELAAWADGLKVSARTRAHYLTKVSQLYSYALRRGWVESNPVALLDRPQIVTSDPGIFTVEEAERLLKHAPEFGLLGYIVLGLFAGLRPAETMRLDAADVRLDAKAIIIGSHIAKHPSRRIVEIDDTLAAWLPRCIPQRGRVVSARNWRRRMAGLRKATGITQWPHDGLRHSAGSYYYALHGDARKAADRLGHSDTRVFHAHYKALVGKAEAERFWALRP